MEGFDVVASELYLLNGNKKNGGYSLDEIRLQTLHLGLRIVSDVVRQIRTAFNDFSLTEQ